MRCQKREVGGKPQKYIGNIRHDSTQEFDIITNPERESRRSHRFLSRESRKQLSFFKVLIKFNKKKVYEQTEESEVAFQDLKVFLADLPILTTLIPRRKPSLCLLQPLIKPSIPVPRMKKQALKTNVGSLLIKAYSHWRDLQSELLIERYKFLKSVAEKLKLGLRLFRLVVGGIVGWIVVGKNPVGFVVVEKFRYNAFVVEVANVEMQFYSVLAITMYQDGCLLYWCSICNFLKRLNKRGERCVCNVAVMTDYSSLGTEPAADEVRDCERTPKMRFGQHDDIQKRMKLHQSVHDMVSSSRPQGVSTRLSVNQHGAEEIICVNIYHNQQAMRQGLEPPNFALELHVPIA
ncbi:protein LAZ1 homolog 1 isoform X1 [Tanacetum coccineum]